ncbi:nitrous oxide reductase accessory protein NosL [Geomonas azotofigens]|uniref:nitrous oxide reductase accessory protein NosL n=1 Tax=Geomonas azotofigens TaxID=2843196 RepID=UPI001C0F851F|nr:nitrous oxide reductase accessory protein NosL [Geomonas azotofigens]MBU5614191.1 nitrous oxide reductase accessory protein NosL [Geomonas azotofigens]
MKKLSFVLILLLNLVGAASASHLDIESHPSCAYCGMDRGKFAHSRVLIEYDDGTSFGACSLHCAAVDLANKIDKAPKTITVGDYRTKTLIDAEKAVWVLGGKKAGVMTGNAKWAFAEKGAAEEFIQENGGAVVTFDEAIKAAYEDMYRDTKQIRERRKMKRSQMQKGGQ